MIKLEIIQQNNYYYITWDGLSWIEVLDLYNMSDKNNLLYLIFEIAKANTVGLMLEVFLSNKDIFWIDQDTYHYDKYELYSDFLEKMYLVKGLIFTNYTTAEKCLVELEKNYICNQLRK